MTETEVSPISQISSHRMLSKDELSKEDKTWKPKFPNATICKISSPNNDSLDAVIVFLSTGFQVETTSAKMYNSETKQFFQFIKIEPKEA
jgi:hypothetical protein